MLELGVLTLNWLQALMLPMTRITGFFIAAPIFSQAAATGRVRVVFDHPLTVAATSNAEAFERERARVEAVLVAGVDDL